MLVKLVGRYLHCYLAIVLLCRLSTYNKDNFFFLKKYENHSNSGDNYILIVLAIRV